MFVCRQVTYHEALKRIREAQRAEREEERYVCPSSMVCAVQPLVISRTQYNTEDCLALEGWATTTRDYVAQEADELTFAKYTRIRVLHARDSQTHQVS